MEPNPYMLPLKNELIVDRVAKVGMCSSNTCFYAKERGYGSSWLQVPWCRFSELFGASMLMEFHFVTTILVTSGFISTDVSHSGLSDVPPAQGFTVWPEVLRFLFSSESLLIFAAFTCSMKSLLQEPWVSLADSRVVLFMLSALCSACSSVLSGVIRGKNLANFNNLLLYSNQLTWGFICTRRFIVLFALSINLLASIWDVEGNCLHMKCDTCFPLTWWWSLWKPYKYCHVNPSLKTCSFFKKFNLKNKMKQVLFHCPRNIITRPSGWQLSLL